MTIYYNLDLSGLPKDVTLLVALASAPVGWVKLLVADGWADNSMLCINTEADGTALVAGGAVDPQVAVTHTDTLSVDNESAHTHFFSVTTNTPSAPQGWTSGATNGPNTTHTHVAEGTTNAGSAHGHGLSGGVGAHSIPKYQEIIVCTKSI